MRRTVSFLLLFVLGARLGAVDSRVTLVDLRQTIESHGIGDLEARRSQIEHDLQNLARFSMNAGIGRIGYRSQSYLVPNEPEWFQVDFGDVSAFDEVVLVPTIWRDADKGFIGDCFPVSFRITAGTFDGEILLREVALPSEFAARIAPLVIECPGTKARWIRLTARELSPRAFDGRYCMQFSEILVFDGNRNIALGRPVTAASVYLYGSGAWAPSHLTDGFEPYLMDAALGHGTRAFTNETDPSVTPTITIDLGSVCIVDELILHVIEQNDTVPQGYLGDYGVPFQFLLEGASTEDFSDAVTLLEFLRTDILDVAPVMPMRLRGAACRYVRLTATEPYIMQGREEDGRRFSSPRLGFAEIEILSQGKNVSTGRPIQLNYTSGSAIRRPANLNDGNNLYGAILPMRQWLNELALRYDLEMELPLVNRELSNRYQLQSTLLTRLKWFLVLLVIAVIGVVFASLYFQQRSSFRTRQRIAADLHDELGANLSAVVLLSELAGEKETSLTQLPGFLERIRALSIRSRRAVKYCADILHTPGLYENLPDEMRRISNRMLADLRYSLDLIGEGNMGRLSQHQRIDLFLFYKECLVNTLRHSGATEVAARMTLDSNSDSVELEVQDNGRGLPGGDSPQIPPSLVRRARLLRARVSALRPEAGGACIRLSFPLRFRWTTPLLRLVHLPRLGMIGK